MVSGHIFNICMFFLLIRVREVTSDHCIYGPKNTTYNGFATVFPF